MPPRQFRLNKTAGPVPLSRRVTTHPQAAIFTGRTYHESPFGDRIEKKLKKLNVVILERVQRRVGTHSFGFFLDTTRP